MHVQIFFFLNCQHDYIDFTQNLLSSLKGKSTTIFLLVVKLFLFSLELVGALDTQKITLVSCGQTHSVAVNEQGQVFAWGAGNGGQLGLGTMEAAVRIPR